MFVKYHISVIPVVLIFALLLSGCNTKDASEKVSMGIETTEAETEGSGEYKVDPSAETTRSVVTETAAEEVTVSISEAHAEDVSKTEEQTTGIVQPETESVEEIETVAVDKEKVETFVREWSPEGDNDYYLSPESSTRLLTEEELSDFNKTELRLIRNEIAARHGWEFSDPVIKSYFITQKWYKPQDGQNDLIQFSEIEKANMELLDELEGREEKVANIDEMNRLIELEKGKEYLITRFGRQDVLSVEGSTIFFNKQCIETNLKGIGKALLCNTDGKSILYISGVSRDNDWLDTFEFVIDEEGIKQDKNHSGEIIANTADAICVVSLPTIIGTPETYKWEFLETTEWQIRGRSVLSYGQCGNGDATFKLIRSMPVYVYNDSRPEAIKIEEGEDVQILTADFRNRSKGYAMAEMKHAGVLVYMPVMYGLDYFPCTEEGIDPIEYFGHNELPNYG